MIVHYFGRRSVVARHASHATGPFAVAVAHGFGRNDAPCDPAYGKMSCASNKRTTEGDLVTRLNLRILTSLLCLTTVVAVAAEPQSGKARIGQWGIDVGGADKAVKPGNDFYKHANGTWERNNQIPADRTAWGAAWMLDAEAERDVRAIVESLPANAAKGSTEQKVGDFFRTYLDDAAIEKAGMAPAKAGLEQIAAVRTHADVGRLLGIPELQLPAPINFYISMDEKNPDRYIVDRDAGRARPAGSRLLPQGRRSAEGNPRQVPRAHRRYARARRAEGRARSRPRRSSSSRPRSRSCTGRSRSAASASSLTTCARASSSRRLRPSYPWGAMLDGGGRAEAARIRRCRARCDRQRSPHAFTTVPVSAWRSYLTYHYLVGVGATCCRRRIDDERFDFYGRTLNGQPQQRERWKRAVAAVERRARRSRRPALRRSGTSRRTPRRRCWSSSRTCGAPTAQRIERPAVDDARRRRRSRSRSSPPSGRRSAIRTSGRTTRRSRSRAGDAFGNAMRSRSVRLAAPIVERLGKPTDRDEWFMTPQTVNAYYNPTFNEIVFPAAILQPPFFDPNADPAVNYGAHRRRDRPRDGPRLRRPGREVGRAAACCARGGSRPTKRRSRSSVDSARRPVRRLRAAARPQGQRPTHARREHRRPRRPHRRATRPISLSLERQARAGARRLHRRAALLPRLGAGVAHAACAMQALRNQVMTDPHSPALFRVQRRRAQHGRLVHGVRRAARRRALPRAREARQHLVKSICRT